MPLAALCLSGRKAPLSLHSVSALKIIDTMDQGVFVLPVIADEFVKGSLSQIRLGEK